MNEDGPPMNIIANDNDRRCTVSSQGVIQNILQSQLRLSTCYTRAIGPEKAQKAAVRNGTMPVGIAGLLCCSHVLAVMQDGDAIMNAPAVQPLASIRSEVYGSISHPARRMGKRDWERQLSMRLLPGHVRSLWLGSGLWQGSGLWLW